MTRINAVVVMCQPSGEWLKTAAGSDNVSSRIDIALGATNFI